MKWWLRGAVENAVTTQKGDKARQMALWRDSHKENKKQSRERRKKKRSGVWLSNIMVFLPFSLSRDSGWCPLFAQMCISIMVYVYKVRRGFPRTPAAQDQLNMAGAVKKKQS